MGAIPAIATVTRVGSETIIFGGDATTVLSRSGDVLDEVGYSATDLYSTTGSVSNAQALRTGTQVPFTMESIEAIAKKYGLDLSKARIDLGATSDDVKHLDDEDAVASASGDHILIGPASFVSEEQLARSLVHELVHVDQYFAGRVGGAERSTLEAEAYAAEHAFWKEYGK